MIEPDPRIAAYIREIEQPGIPYVSTSHCTLHALCIEYGHEIVHRLVQDYFLAKRGG